MHLTDIQVSKSKPDFNYRRKICLNFHAYLYASSFSVFYYHSYQNISAKCKREVAANLVIYRLWVYVKQKCVFLRPSIFQKDAFY